MIVPGHAITIYVDDADLHVLRMIAAARGETEDQVVYRLSIESIRRAWDEATAALRGSGEEGDA